MKTADSADDLKQPAAPQRGLSGASTLFVIPSAVEESLILNRGALEMSRSEPDWHIRSTGQSSSPTRDDTAGVGPFPLKVSFLRPIPENDDRCRSGRAGVVQE